MRAIDHRLVLLATAFIAAGPVAAQDAPSWRALQEQPARPNPPPEIERPKYEFSVSRDEVEGFAVRPDAAVPASPAVPGRSGVAAEPPAAPAPPAAAVESRDQRVQIVAAPEVEALPAGEAESAMAFAYSPEPLVTNPFDPLAADVAGLGVQPPSEYRLVRRRTVEPEYPRKAYRDGVEGWVNLRVTVDPSGEVQDVEVLDADPLSVFDDAAQRAVRKWRFEPPESAGVTSPLSGVYRISFTMGEG